MKSKDIIKKYHFKDGLKLEFEILDLSKVFKSYKQVMTVPHRAQFYHVLWVEKGEGTHFVDFHPITIEDNSVIFIAHNCVNRFDEKGSYKGKGLLFTDSFFCINDQDVQFLHSSILFSDLYGIAKIKITPDLKRIFDAMDIEFQRNYDNVQYNILQNLLHVFLLQAERAMRKQGFEELKPSANLDYLLLFKDLLEDNFRREKSVKNYASELSISEKQLHKATTTLLDKTPKQIINERVLLEAKRLLVHSNHPIKSIAYELGYDEPTNFIKYFRKYIGTTPSEFREQY